jgi:hypothetical protein
VLPLRWNTAHHIGTHCLELLVIALDQARVAYVRSTAAPSKNSIVTPDAESPCTLFEVLFTRWQPSVPSVIVYDNSYHGQLLRSLEHTETGWTACTTSAFGRTGTLLVRG